MFNKCGIIERLRIAVFFVSVVVVACPEKEEGVGESRRMRGV